MQQVGQHIPAAHGQKLVGISHQNQMAGRIHLAQEPGQHLQRHHTGLVYNDQIYRRPDDWAEEILIREKSQGTVHCTGNHAGSLR